MLQPGSKRRTSQSPSRQIQRHLAGGWLRGICRVISSRHNGSSLHGARSEEIHRHPCRDEVTSGVGSAATDRGTVRGRGSDPWRAGRNPAEGPRGTECAAVRRSPKMAGHDTVSCLRQRRDGQGDPLRPGTLGRIDPGVARRPRLHRQQCRRTVDAADDDGAFIIPLLFKCLERLEVHFGGQLDAGSRSASGRR